MSDLTQVQQLFSTFPQLTKRRYFSGISYVKLKPILDFLSQNQDHHIPLLANTVKVSENTLRKWEQKLRENPLYDPTSELKHSRRNQILS